MKYLLTLILLTFYLLSCSQDKFDSEKIPFRADVGIGTAFTKEETLPFWIRSRQYGSIPLKGASGFITGEFEKDYNLNRSKFDWGASLDVRYNTGYGSNFQLIEGYVKARWNKTQLKLGRSRDMEGLIDSALSTGSFSVSGNALGIPKIELSVPDYYNLLIFDGIFAVKGNISYGLMGKVPIQYGERNSEKLGANYHHFSLYGRLGKPTWKAKLFAAINHDVIWGNDDLIFGNQYQLSDVSAFYYVLTGKKYKGAEDISKIGNHLGSIDVAVEYDFINYNINAYHQFFYDKGALGYLANIKDGLTGIRLINKRPKSSNTGWEKILIEFFYSKDQAGQEGAKFTPSGPEYYYNHAVYTEGFSYKNLGIGNPLITPLKDSKKGQVSDPINYFVNNRVKAFHLGVIGYTGKFDWTLKATLSKNYGDFRTSGPNEQWFNGERVRNDFIYGRFNPVTQFSGYLETLRRFNKGYTLGLVLAIDYGDLLYNNTGGVIKLSKKLN